MADLAALLLRTVSRAFYTTDHTLVIDALLLHSTLSAEDLAYTLGMQPKSLRKLCGRLKEDGLLSVQTRAERRTDGSQTFYSRGGSGDTNGGEKMQRITNRDWYYLNFHRAIDSIKFRMYRLNKHVESLGAPTTEKKDLVCPRCKSSYTELEVMDRIDVLTGAFMCKRCGHELQPVEEDERANENETMKRLNSQLEKILRLLQQIDAANVPENDFQTALSKQRPVSRTDANPGQQRTEIVDLPNRNLASTKGLDIKPEKIAVQLESESQTAQSSSTEAAEAAAKREKEAKQNALPDWILKSTVSGDITAAGAKEERLRRERETNFGLVKDEDDGERKPVMNGTDDDLMASYWEELAKANAEEAARAKASDDEEEDDGEDEFEDVDAGGPDSDLPTPMTNGRGNANESESHAATPIMESSNATDDERDTKRVKKDDPGLTGPTPIANGVVSAQDTPAASDEDEDDEIEFEDV